MQNKGEVIAFDKSKSKIKSMQKLINDQNIKILKAICQNATKAIEVIPSTQTRAVYIKKSHLIEFVVTLHVQDLD
jgi:16S rRNA C967 or C1407 C5-methylase (RsmB/RsmF family)